MVWEVVIPDVPRLDTDEIPWMMPRQLQKYLRAYVLWRCFSRQGESYRPDLAAWWEQRWRRGLAVFKKLGWLARRDRDLQRQPKDRERSRTPRPRLPSDFPRWIGV
jgi:hypothetical protein